LVPVIAVALAGYFRPDRAIRVATGAVADSVCARTFVSGLDPQAVFAETMDRPGIRRLRWLMRYQLDRAAKTVDASVIGLLGSRAAFHDGFGCVLLRGSKAPYLLKSDVEALKVPKSPPLLPEIAGPDIVQPSGPALKAALDHAFEEPAEPPFRRTKAVVVVHEGSVIAERYAPGVRVDTQLVGFSMTKSVVNALLGILTQQGLISPSLPAPIPEWRGANDPRREIEVEHLMRMTTGLALDETNTGFDPSNQMYLYGDMAGFAVTAPMIAPPGKRWAYSSATTQLLARIVRPAPLGYRRRQRRRDPDLLRQNAKQGVDHRLGHGKTGQWRIDADTIGITLGDRSALMDHDDRFGSPKRRLRGFFEGMIECGF